MKEILVTDCDTRRGGGGRAVVRQKWAFLLGGFALVGYVNLDKVK